MSRFDEHLADYLATRRGHGYKLDSLGLLNKSFLAWLDTQNRESFTVADAVSWAMACPTPSRSRWATRLGAVRTFAAWLQASGITGVEVPPARLLACPSKRATPYMYSATDTARLIGACPDVFLNKSVASTMATLIGLLAVTGIRIGEALALVHGHLDQRAGVLTVYSTKTGQTRILPLHPTTVAELARYLDTPSRRQFPRRVNDPIFVNTIGHPVGYTTVQENFRKLITKVDLPDQTPARPRIHDLRHSFATNAMTTAYRDGTDPARTLSLLSTWLGHHNPAATYWYLTAAPQLLAHAADRLEKDQT
ncbi:MAG: tyrosine-type recombinase/integrase [Propionibacteriaceae bacterium]|nr:tyrosine-type recombinase/integrase [Propionibacteriaceae bacterium]